MFQKIYNRYLRKRHYWRIVEFDELSELYTTQMLRSLSSSLVGIFVPIYLYKIGYSITDIGIFFLIWFAVRPLMVYFIAKLIGEIGPKHTMILSVGVQIAYLSFVLTIQTMHWPLFIVAILGSLCFGMYRMAFEVDFSKVKHPEHGGKEIGYMQIFERVGGVLGPLIGGMIAGFFGPRYTLSIAILVLTASLLPLLATAEPIKRHQVIILKGFPLKKYSRSLVLSGVYQLQEIINGTLWPLFLGAFILLEGTYQILGVLVSLSTLIAIVSSYSIGKLIDKEKGGYLLKLGATINAFVMLIKPFVNNVITMFTVNFIREPAASMYRIPFIKGRYDEADNVPGYRIVYFMYTEIAICIANVIMWGIIVILSYKVDAKLSLQIAFIIGGISSFALTRQRFAALR